MPSIRIPLAATLALLAACGSRDTAISPGGDPPARQQVMVEIRPASVSILPGESVEFTSVVTGSASTAVTWEVVQEGGGDVSTAGTYVGPLETGDFTVRATSLASPDKSSTAQVKVRHVAVSVSPAAATVPAGGRIAFAASVRGAKDKSVRWSLREPSGCGSIDASGVYMAPPSAATCHAIATSVADPTADAQATVTVTAPASPTPPPIAVTVTPAAASMDTCRSVAFTATVSGSSNGGVAWSVREGDAGGSVTPAGVYTAPTIAGTYHVVATSQADPAATATVPVSATDRILGVAVSPANVALAPGASARLTATVTTTCGTSTSTSTVTAPN